MNESEICMKMKNVFLSRVCLLILCELLFLNWVLSEASVLYPVKTIMSRFRKQYCSTCCRAVRYGQKSSRKIWVIFISRYSITINITKWLTFIFPVNSMKQYRFKFNFIFITSRWRRLNHLNVKHGQNEVKHYHQVKWRKER